MAVPSGSSVQSRGARPRVRQALGERELWIQFGTFAAVGASGVVVNLIVFAVLVRGLDVHYAPAAVASFLVAVTNNYTWNRAITFRDRRGPVVGQGLRFLVVSTVALSANLALLHALVAAGTGELLAQALAILVVTPLNFLGNRLWSFARRR